MEFVEEARKVLLPVTRATIQSLGVAARDELSAVVLTSADDKNNLEMFGASEKLVRNFLLRHGMSSTCLLYTSPSPRDGLLSRMPSSA